MGSYSSNINETLNAVMIFILLGGIKYLHSSIVRSRKQSANDHLLLKMKVECIDVGLCSMNGSPQNNEFSKAYKKERDAEWERQVTEHKIQIEGIK